MDIHKAIRRQMYVWPVAVAGAALTVLLASPVAGG